MSQRAAEREHRRFQAARRKLMQSKLKPHVVAFLREGHVLIIEDGPAIMSDYRTGRLILMWLTDVPECDCHGAGF